MFIAKRIILLCWFNFFTCPMVFGQQKYIDSIRNLVVESTKTPSQKLILQGELAECTRFTNIDTSTHLIIETIALARKLNDEKVLANVYCNAARIYQFVDSFKLMTNAVDSAIFFADKQDDNVIKGWAYFRKASSFTSLNENKQVVDFCFRALTYAENTNDKKLLVKIYYTLYGIYAEAGELVLEEKYAKLTLAASLASKDPEAITYGWQAYGTSFSDQYDVTKKQNVLDSCFVAYKNGINEFNQKGDYIIMQDELSILLLNTASQHFRNYMPKHKDSVIKYANLALENAIKNNNTTVEASCYGLLSALAFQQKDLQGVETLLLKALARAKQIPITPIALLSQIYFSLAELYKQKGDTKKALFYFEEYNNYHGQTLDADTKMNSQILDAKYEFKKNEEKINLLKEKNELNEKQKFFSYGIALAALLGLIFMFRSYHFKLKFAEQQKKLSQAKAEEAILEAKLKKLEADKLLLEKEEATLTIQLQEQTARRIEEESARIKVEQQLTNAKNEQLQKELLAGALQVEHKNEMLHNLKTKLGNEQLSAVASNKLNKIINEEIRIDEGFEKVTQDFKDIDPIFFNKIQSISIQKLTSLDLKYCAYIKLKLTSKEMATLLNVEPSSIRTSKHRLKQKLGLGKEVDLDTFLLSGV
jgi:hypothetical protein